MLPEACQSAAIRHFHPIEGSRIEDLHLEGANFESAHRGPAHRGLEVTRSLEEEAWKKVYADGTPSMCGKAGAMHTSAPLIDLAAN
jgi:hypothetical protein